MKRTRILAFLIAVLTVITMIPITALTSFAYTVTDKVKEVALTVAEPAAGLNVNLDYSSVTVEHYMTYKVVGVNWYKNDSKEHLGTGNADKYFIGGETYTVRIDLALKGANSGWNFDYNGENTDYSGIKATINGKEATVTYRELNPDAKTISVMHTFEYIPVKEVTPIVYIPTPVAGSTYPSLEKIETGSSRSMIIAPSSYLWYVNDGGKWKTMDLDEKFVAGKHYKVEFDIQTTQGFKFSMDTIHQPTENRYIMGYINGRQTSMKLIYMGVGEDNEKVYSDERVSAAMEFVSCTAQELGNVSFSGVTEPSEGQKPVYTAPTMGDENYSLVTDDAVTGGAQYGFVNGISWSCAGTAVSADSTFKKGDTYTMSFFIKSDDTVYQFSDYVEATSDKGYVEVITMAVDPTLAFVSITFGPCEGGVLNEISISGVEEPVHSQKPDYDFIYGQGFGKGGDNAIEWYDVTANAEVGKNDTFVYGHKYELRIRLASEAVLHSGDSDFVFAPHASMKVKVNGKDAAVSAYANNPEELWAFITVSFDCAKAVIDHVEVNVEHPVEGNNPAKRLELVGDTYKIESFVFVDGDTYTALKSDDVFEGAKNYTVTVILVPVEGYEINENISSAVINGQQAYIFGVVDGKIVFNISLLSDELPYYFIGFNPGEGGNGYMDDIKVKVGKVTLPDCDFVAPMGKQFLGWSTDGTVDGIIPQVITVTEGLSLTAMWESPEDHTHVYGDEFNGHDDFEHYKLCISPNCPQLGSWETKGETMGHNWGNNSNCDSVCVDCGYERTVNQAGEPLHFYEHECSEFCPNCGEFRENVTHTPGEEADCDSTQYCTVCGKTLANAKGHTPGNEADCGHDQTCTVCGDVLDPATGAHTPGEEGDCEHDQVCTVCGEILNAAAGEHTPGEEATCTTSQTCTVCGKELAPATGHSAGVEWITDENGHHKLCVCGEKLEAGEHTDTDGNGKCDVCEYGSGSVGLSTGAIIGIVAGAVVLVGGGIGACLVVGKKKKTAKK